MEKLINALEQIKDEAITEMVAMEIGSFEFVKAANEIAEITYSIENAHNEAELRQMLYRTTSDKLCAVIHEYLK